MNIKGYNIKLTEKRYQLGLTLSQMRERTHIPALALYFYECGYFIVPRKRYAAIEKGYELEEGTLEKDLLYPDFPVKQKKEKKPNKFLNFFTTIYGFIVLFFLLAGTISMIPLGNNRVVGANGNVLTFYSDNFNIARTQILTKGEPTPSVLHKDDFMTYTKEVVEQPSSGLKITSITSFTCPKDDNNIKEICFDYTAKTDEILTETIKYGFSYRGVYVLYKLNQTEVSFIYNNGKFTIEEVCEYFTSLTSLYKKYTDQDAEYYIYAGLGISSVKQSFIYFDDVIQNDFGITNYKFTDFLTDLIVGNSNYQDAFYSGSTMMICGGILAAGLVIAIGFAFSKVYTIKITKNLNLISEESDIETVKRCPLERNNPAPLIIGESIFRIGIIAMLLIASVGMYGFVSHILNIIGIGRIHETLDIKVLKSAFNFFQVTSSLTSVAVIMHMFLKIDTLISTKGYFKNTIMHFSLGIVFYVFEVLVMYSLSNGLNNLGSIANLVSAYIPGNVFWGMSVYSMFIMFLFFKPKFAMKRKKLLYAWRFGIIIPVAYLFISSIYSILVAKSVWNALPYYFAYLLYPKSLETTIFVLAFTLGIYFYRRFAIEKYGQTNAQIFLSGNKYVMVKNMIAAALIFILGLIELAVYINNKNNDLANKLGFGKCYYLIALTPIFLFYHPMVGERNAKVDLVYTTLYGVSYAMSYILIAITILPNIGFLQPLLEILLR